MAAVTTNARLADIFGSKSVAGYYDTLKEDVRPYFGETIFPADKMIGMELKSFLGEAGVPVLLRGSAFDAHAPIRPRIPFQRITNEMPFFRESMKIGEQERQSLLQALALGDAYATPIIERIYDDQFHLVLGADAAVERMRMALLSTGSIQLESDQVPISADYGFNAATQMTSLTGAAAWNNPATATPLQDIQDAMLAAKLRRARIVMTQPTFNLMIRAESVRNAMYPQNPPSFITPNQYREYIASALGVTFIIIDPESNAYAERVGGGEYQMFPDGVATLLPETGTMGKTWYGTTPEEADLLLGSTADVSIVGTGVAVTTIIEPHPVNINTIASQIVLPSCEGIKRMHIINAYAA